MIMSPKRKDQHWTYTNSMYNQQQMKNAKNKNVWIELRKHSSGETKQANITAFLGD